MSKKVIQRETVFQHAVALRGLQYLERLSGTNEERQEKMEQLQNELAGAIAHYGGIAKIDKWLGRHHRDHSTLSAIQDLDWSWLDQHPVTVQWQEASQKRRRRWRVLAAVAIVIVVALIALYVR